MFTVKGLVKILFPIMNIGDGFTSAYLVFYLFIPFLNILVQNMSEKQQVKILILCSFTYIFLGTMPGFSVTMNYVSWFMVLYLFASYIRLYTKKIYTNIRIWGIKLCLAIAFSIVSVLICAWLSMKYNAPLAFLFVTDSNTFLAVLTGIFAFMFFKNLHIKYNK